MRSLTDMTKSLSRATSMKQGKRSMSIDEPKPSFTVSAPTQPTTAPSPNTVTPASIQPKQPVDDLLSIVDALARPPNVEILRPFDSIPPPRASESKSMRGKKRRSVVGNLPPTVGKVENDSMPFGDSFKSFLSEPEPVAQHDDHKLSTSPRSDGHITLMSSTTLSENSTSKSVSEPHHPAATMKHGSSSKDIGSYFKSLFTMKSRVSTFLNKAEADGPAGMHKSDPSAIPTESKKGRNVKDLSIPVSPTEGKFKDSTNGTPQNNTQLRAPASPNPSVKSGSIRYDHGVLLHPVAEEKETE